MNTSVETTTLNPSSVFSAEEIKKAENILLTLAKKSADYWMNALSSEAFIVNGRRIDFTYGYKNRHIEIQKDSNAVPISKEMLETFKDEYLLLAKEETKRYLKNDIAIANLLTQKDKVIIPLGQNCSEFRFGGWDNDPYGAVAKAMSKSGIIGKMNGRYTKTAISLLSDGSIHEGWYLWKPII